MLAKIKTLLGISDTSKDSLLTLLISMVNAEATNYIHDDDLDDLEYVLIEMVIYKYNRLGTEGVDSEDYDSVSFDYSSDYPESILKQLRTYRKVRVI